VHVAAAALGLSTLMVTVPAVYDVVRLAGAGYLVWLGVGALRSHPRHLTLAELAPVSMGTIFRQGMLTNALNPKVALFFLAFLPQFTDAARGPLALQFVLLGLLFIANGLVVCVAYAVAASALGSWLTSRFEVHAWLNRAMGALFVALGVRLALATRR
jgi:threonine/homoserine/homoserine lactone efflux protein